MLAIITANITENLLHGKQDRRFFHDCCPVPLYISDCGILALQVPLHYYSCQRIPRLHKVSRISCRPERNAYLVNESLFPRISNETNRRSMHKLDKHPRIVAQCDYKMNLLSE